MNIIRAEQKLKQTDLPTIPFLLTLAETLVLIKTAIMKKIIFSFVIMLSFVIVSCNNYSKEQLEQDVKTSIIVEANDPNIKVNSVNLIKTQENSYEGFVNTTESGEKIQYNISVVVDGDEFIWEVY